MKLMQLLSGNHSARLAAWLYRPLQIRFDRPQHPFAAVAIATTLAGQAIVPTLAQAQSAPYCQQTPEAIAQKDQHLRAWLQGDKSAQKRYASMVKQHGDRLKNCRRQTWPQTAAIWIRLYPCDARPGALDAVFDRIMDRGYNQVYVEAFGGGKVLLPTNANPTPWRTVLAGTRAQDVDLLAQAIRKGHERGMKVYAWMFSLNYGAEYFRRGDRRSSFARNGLGQDSLTASLVPGLSSELGLGSPDEVFVDPYNPQARQDYQRLVQAVLQRKPDGVLFDYIRYPRGSGPQSVSSKVQDLWVYGEASRTVLLQRALNYKGMELINRYMTRGYITADDLNDVNYLYPKDGEPLWQGRTPGTAARLPSALQVTVLQAELWQLAVAHAFQGVLDFLNLASQPVLRSRIPAGVVFFPEGNQAIGQGFDSRLQFWERFPRNLEWHPMSYGVCGKTTCILKQIRRVLSYAPSNTQVKPVLAGIWQEPISNRPPLEVQMRDIYRAAPQLKSVSHFAYSWQEPGSDRDRKFCQP